MLPCLRHYTVIRRDYKQRDVDTGDTVSATLTLADTTTGSLSANDGASYDPSTDTWSAIDSSGAPAARGRHTAVWTGTEMIIWGGGGGTNYGARYNPGTDTWTATSQGTNCPLDRYNHGAVWTGSRMIVWGGGPSPGAYSGGVYDPGADAWLPTSTGTNCPGRRTEIRYAVVWTGTRMIVWGGNGQGGALDTGGLYDPVTDSWETMSMGPNLPHARSGHTLVWTGSEAIVWGGVYNSVSPSFVDLNDGGHYDPITNTWRSMPTANAPSARNSHTAVWTGSEMIVWGGSYYQGGTWNYIADGGRYWCGP